MWEKENPLGIKEASLRGKLFDHPVRPYPVKIVLDGPGVDQAPGMEDESGPEQFNGFLHF
jgi:hypothetical protein